MASYRHQKLVLERTEMSAGQLQMSTGCHVLCGLLASIRIIDSAVYYYFNAGIRIHPNGLDGGQSLLKVGN